MGWVRVHAGAVAVTGVKLTQLDRRAISFALEELEAYVSAVGTEDDAYERHMWTIARLYELLERSPVQGRLP